MVAVDLRDKIRDWKSKRKKKLTALFKVSKSIQICRKGSVRFDDLIHLASKLKAIKLKTIVSQQAL